MRRCLTGVVILLFALLTGGASTSAMDASDTSQQTTESKATSSAEDCSISEFARKAINETKSVERLTWESLALIRQAEAVAEPPECDSLKATSLANEAKRLAEENLVSLNAKRLSNPLTQEARDQEARARKYQQQQDIETRRNRIAYEESKKTRHLVLFTIFGTFLLLTVTCAIYWGYQCVASEDEKRKAIDSDKLALVSLILLYACVLVPFYWYIYRVDYGPRFGDDWIEIIAIPEAILSGFIFACIPGVMAKIASKRADKRKLTATRVTIISFSCFTIGLFILLFGHLASLPINNP